MYTLYVHIMQIKHSLRDVAVAELQSLTCSFGDLEESKCSTLRVVAGVIVGYIKLRQATTRCKLVATGHDML